MKLLNQSGEAVIIFFLLFSALGIGYAHEVRRLESEHAKEMHYEKWHKDAVQEQKKIEEALKKSKGYRI